VPVNPEHDALAELVASRHDLSSALTRLIDFQVKQMNRTPEEAAAFVRSRDGIPAEEREPQHVSWYDLAALLESEPGRGETLWQRVKAQAAAEQDSGTRASLAIEQKVPGHPMDRARFMVVLAGLRDSLKPRDALENLMLQQMASAYEQHLFWTERAAQRAQEEEWEGDRDRRREWERLSPAQKERYALDHGWMPPRVSTHAAIDQAVLIADRYQRSFLRLLKALRDQRRLVGTLVVAGGQVNIGERQVNVAAAEPDDGDA